jgi:cell division protein ZapA
MGAAQPGDASMAKRLKVEIYDQIYNIGGELDEAYVTELARYVDAKMREVAEATKTVDSLRVAVLAALAIADELHSMRQGQGETERSLRERAERCLTLVERALKQSA